MVGVTAWTDDEASAAQLRIMAWDKTEGPAGQSLEAEARDLAEYVLNAVAPAIAARALREAADDLDEFRTFTYGEDMFVRPTTDEYAAINAVLKREFEHGTDRIAADCMDRAIKYQADRLRARAEVSGDE